MTKWEHLEQWIAENDIENGSFTSVDLAHGLEITRPEASELIQFYLIAQRGRRSKTLYVLRREGLTRNARWHVGIRTTDARGVGQQLFGDVTVKFRRAVEPDLKRIARRNPLAAHQCETIIEAVGEGVMRILQVAVGGAPEGDEREAA